MGIEINPYGKVNYNLSHKSVKNVSYNTKVAIWQLPDNFQKELVARYDEDDNQWLEAINKNYECELDNFENEHNINLDKFKVATKTTSYSDLTFDIETRYPNGNKIKEYHAIDYVLINIKDKFNRLVAEKIYNYSSEDGRKIIYKNVEKDGNIFTVVKVYTYNTNINRSSDIVNYGYTNKTSALRKGCKLQKEHYLLNGKEVNAEKISKFEYNVTDENGKKLKFETR